ncbi:hypothetical protein Leryth_021784 [Lithospermum erythrorhizon]|nr:hypothetical protein Leryth_021784 [Lithospermum erythrorhizon]
MGENLMLRRIEEMKQRFDLGMDSFKSTITSPINNSQQTAQLLERLGKLKVELRGLEASLVNALAVKTRKEAKRMAMVDSLSVARCRVGELQRIVEDQRERKDEYAAIMSDQSNALMTCEEKYAQNVQRREEIEEAMSWYNKVLGFRIECGRGVKFTFTNINPKNPDEEYSFTVRYENDIYTLIECEPNLNDTKELINELNSSNRLFKFVRTMREKFQGTVGCGFLPQVTCHDQETTTISLSAPVSSVFTDNSSSPTEHDDLQSAKSSRQKKKVSHGKGGRHGVMSPTSASASRRSSRIQAKTFR